MKKNNNWLVMRSSFIARLFTTLIPIFLFTLVATGFIFQKADVLVALFSMLIVSLSVTILSEYMIRRERKKINFKEK